MDKSNKKNRRTRSGKCRMQNAAWQMGEMGKWARKSDRMAALLFLNYVSNSLVSHFVFFSFPLFSLLPSRCAALFGLALQFASKVKWSRASEGRGRGSGYYSNIWKGKCWVLALPKGRLNDPQSELIKQQSALPLAPSFRLKHKSKWGLYKSDYNYRAVSIVNKFTKLFMQFI